jgi:hypothetical protein
MTYDLIVSQLNCHKVLANVLGDVFVDFWATSPHDNQLNCLPTHKTQVLQLAATTGIRTYLQLEQAKQYKSLVPQKDSHFLSTLKVYADKSRVHGFSIHEECVVFK